MTSRRRYRGRRNSGVIKTLVVLLAIICALLLLAYFVLKDFIVFDEKGITLDIPIFRESPSPPPTPEAPPEIKIEIIDTAPPLAEPEDLPAPEPLKLRAVFVPQAALLKEGAAQEYTGLCASTSINALILEMKPESGKLSYNSRLIAASGASGQSGAAEQAITAFNDEGIYLAAYIACFRDNTAPRNNTALAVMHKQGVTWLDDKSSSWLNPYSPQARDYIEGLALELCDLGFKEIILDRICFASTGQVGQIDYGGESETPRTQIINNFLAALRQKLSAKGVVLTCIPEPSALIGGLDADTGQDLAMIAENADRIMARIPQKDLASEFSQIEAGVSAVMEPGSLEIRFTPIVTAPKNPAAQSSAEKMATDIGLCGASLNLGFVAYSTDGRYPAEAFAGAEAGVAETGAGQESEAP